MKNTTGKFLYKKIRKNEDCTGQWGDVIGLVMSTGKGLVGYSFANIKHGDKFNRELAEKICKERMSDFTVARFEHDYEQFLGRNNMATRIFFELNEMYVRSLRYYKDGE